MCPAKTITHPATLKRKPYIHLSQCRRLHRSSLDCCTGINKRTRQQQQQFLGLWLLTKIIRPMSRCIAHSRDKQRAVAARVSLANWVFRMFTVLQESYICRISEKLVSFTFGMGCSLKSGGRLNTDKLRENGCRKGGSCHKDRKRDKLLSAWEVLFVPYIFIYCWILITYLQLLYLLLKINFIFISIYSW